MPLFDIHDNEQDPTGKGLHWKFFEKFENSDLHKLFRKEINKMVLERDTIDSKLAGAIIIENLKKDHKDLITRQKNVTGLFGMTLWNILAQEDDNWYFSKEESDERGITGTNYWRDIPR